MNCTPLVTACLALLVASCGRSEKHSNAPLHEAPASAPTAQQEPHGHGHGPLGNRFEKADQWVSVFDDPARDSWQQPADVVALLQLHPGHIVADIGAGTGYFLPHLSRAVGRGGTVVGIDIEADMVRHMRERAEREGLKNVRVRQGKPNDATLSPASTDRILIVNTWHHIPDRREYARKLRDALRPRGRVFVIDYTLESPHGPPKDHRIEPGRVVEELKAGGLDASIVEEDLPRQYVIVGKKP